MQLTNALVFSLLSTGISAHIGALEAREAVNHLQGLEKRQIPDGLGAATSLFNQLESIVSTCTDLSVGPSALRVLTGIPTPPSITQSIDWCSPSPTGAEGSSYSSWTSTLSKWESENSGFLSSWSASVNSVCPAFITFISDLTAAATSITGASSCPNSTGSKTTGKSSTGKSSTRSSTGTGTATANTSQQTGDSGAGMKGVSVMAGALAAGLGLVAAL